MLQNFLEVRLIGRFCSGHGEGLMIAYGACRDIRTTVHRNRNQYLRMTVGVGCPEVYLPLNPFHFPEHPECEGAYTHSRRAVSSFPSTLSSRCLANEIMILRYL